MQNIKIKQLEILDEFCRNDEELIRELKRIFPIGCCYENRIGEIHYSTCEPRLWNGDDGKIMLGNGQGLIYVRSRTANRWGNTQLITET